MHPLSKFLDPPLVLDSLNKCVFLVLTNSVISRDCNISFNLLETRPPVANLQSQNDLQTEGRVSSKLSDMLQSLEIELRGHTY